MLAGAGPSSPSLPAPNDPSGCRHGTKRGLPNPWLPLERRWDAACRRRGVKQSDSDGEERASEAQVEDPSFIDEALSCHERFSAGCHRWWPPMAARGR